MLHSGVAHDGRNTLVQLLLPPCVRTGVWFPLLQVSFGSFLLLHFTSTSRGWLCCYASVNGKGPPPFFFPNSVIPPHHHKIQPEKFTAYYIGVYSVSRLACSAGEGTCENVVFCKLLCAVLRRQCEVNL